MSMKNLADPESACKPVQPGQAAGSEHAPGPLAGFAALAGGGPVLMTTARFGRSSVRDAAYRLRDRRPDLHLKLSWRLFASLSDWGKRWVAEQDAFAAGLILSAAGDPVVERAVGRCLADLARLGRPLLWGVVGPRLRWRPRFRADPERMGAGRDFAQPLLSMPGSRRRTTRPSSARGSIRSSIRRNRISAFPTRA